MKVKLKSLSINLGKIEAPIVKKAARPTQSNTKKYTTSPRTSPESSSIFPAVPIAAREGVLPPPRDPPGVLVDLRTVDDGVAESAAERAALGPPVRPPRAGGGVLEGVVHYHEDGGDALVRLLQEVLEVEERRLLAALVDERGRDAGLAAPAGPADAVDVVLDLAGHVEVYHVLYVGEVESLFFGEGRVSNEVRSGGENFVRSRSGGPQSSTEQKNSPSPRCPWPPARPSFPPCTARWPRYAPPDPYPRGCSRPRPP